MRWQHVYTDQRELIIISPIHLIVVRMVIILEMVVVIWLLYRIQD